MRINKYLAQATGMSRRAADAAIAEGRVLVNDTKPTQGQDVTDSDSIRLDHKLLRTAPDTRTIMLNKPVGVVVSRDGQGSKTIYDLLPPELHHLKPVGRLDKDSSGLLLLTNDGQLAQELTHPKYQKTKIYEVTLDKPLAPTDFQKLNKGIRLEDGISRLTVQGQGKSNYEIQMTEGRNRQIRRTFESLGYTVTKLHRTQFGNYQLTNLHSGEFR